jgi:multiple antibiotic resistance protein
MYRLGEDFIHIITRVLGLVLAALAVQYILNGLTGFYQSLVRQ